MNTTQQHYTLVSAKDTKPVGELLGWCGDVAETNWRTKDDADLTLVELYERDKPDGEAETAEVAAFGGCGQEANARLCAAAPRLYDAARRALAFVEHSSLIGAAELRLALSAALVAAGGRR